MKINPILLGFFCFYGSSILYAECSDPSRQENDFCINEESFNENGIVTFYASSFDFATGESDVDFFRYRIIRDYDNSGSPMATHLFLDYTISIYSPGLEIWYTKELFKGRLKILYVNNDVIIHNSDFSAYTTDISGFSVIPQIESYPSKNEMDGIVQKILQTGKMPDGVYSFTVDMYQQDPNNPTNEEIFLDSIERSVEIYSPVFIELLSPGGNLSDTTDTKIFSSYPVFQWVTDYCPDCNYGIRVCEFDPSKHSSLSEALDDVSSIPLSQSEQFYMLGNINSFQYPSSEVIDLIPGKYYAWQINRQFQTSMGNEQNSSNINIFKLESPGGSDDGALEVILTLLGEGKYNELFGPDGELRGYGISGSNIIVNGEEFPVNQLNQIASQVQQGALKIREVEVE